jgi:hypothetical protein
MVEAKEEEEANQIDTLNTTALKIYELLDEVAHGNGYFRVKVDNYGLTKASSGGSIGGVNALGDSGSSFGSSTSGSGVNVGGSVDFGGWTTVL